MKKERDDWATTLKFRGLELQTGNKWLAIAVVGTVLLILVFWLARDLLGALWVFLSAWAGSLSGLLLLVIIFAYLERQQKGRRAKALPYLQKNWKLVGAVLLLLSFLLAFGGTGTDPTPAAGTVPTSP